MPSAASNFLCPVNFGAVCACYYALAIKSGAYCITLFCPFYIGYMVDLANSYRFQTRTFILCGCKYICILRLCMFSEFCFSSNFTNDTL